LPGTKFYERVKNDLTAKSNWTDSDELALMFKNTYPPAFYKILHRLTHSIFRRARAIEKLGQKNPFATKLKAVLSFVKYSFIGGLQQLQLNKQIIYGSRK
jgi:hypothetical protein